MSRLRASSIHLLLCVVIAFVLLLLFWFVWYPAPLFKAVGGQEIFWMLLGIDVVLGPLLTLIVFKTGKKTLKFDLAFIGAVQIAALIYGVFTLLSGRPVYIAALGHRFDLIQASEIVPEQSGDSGVSLPKWGPKWVGIKPATDKKERENMMLSGLAGADYGHFPKYHQPIENMRDEILANTQTISDLKKFNSGKDAEIDAWLSSRNLTADDVRYQGLKARSESFSVILDAKTAQVIAIAPFKPWH
jgi:hypothetical protein